MTTEQREAIEELKSLSPSEGAINTVLSMLKEKDKEIEKKDKQIDLMAELVYKRFKAELLLEYGFENEEQLKQYFADLVEKE